MYSRTARRATRALVVAALALTALVGCSSDSGEGSGDAPAGTQEPISVTITDDEISPMGERVKIKAGSPVDIEITADRDGALHVHSTPEQTLEFVDGTVTRTITLDQPGVVEVESHDPDLVILQLEVR